MIQRLLAFTAIVFCSLIHSPCFSSHHGETDEYVLKTAMGKTIRELQEMEAVVSLQRREKTLGNMLRVTNGDLQVLCPSEEENITPLTTLYTHLNTHLKDGFNVTNGPLDVEVKALELYGFARGYQSATFTCSEC